MSDEVLYEVRDGAAWITINRPEARNALNEAVRTSLKECFERAEVDDDVAVVVLTGAGDRAFCAGGDLKEMASTQLTVPPRDFVPQPGRTIAMTKPVIAAVNGGAFGGGFLLAQSADLVVAADHATFAVSEARVGRGSPWAAPLPWLVPPRAATTAACGGTPPSARPRVRCRWRDWRVAKVLKAHTGTAPGPPPSRASAATRSHRVASSAVRPGASRMRVRAWARRASSNDADRLRKYLQRFDLSWQELHDQA